MLPKTVLKTSLAGSLILGAIVPAAANADGVQRNQAALAMAARGTPCTAAAAATPALRQQCALRTGSSAFQEEDDSDRRDRVSPFIVGGLAIGAVGLGLAAALSHDDDADGGNFEPAPGSS